MKGLILFIFISFLAPIATGQEFQDSLYFHLYNYQVLTGELELGLNLDELDHSFNIENLIDSSNTETFSIYKFYNLKYEESLMSFLIVEEENVEIYDILSFDVLIERILDLNICNEEKKILWVKEVLKILRNYYEDANMENLVVEKVYGKYHYFIPLKNLKSKEGIVK